MAQLLCIGTVRHQKGVQEAGDIIGVFDDKHVFSGTEQDIFDIYQFKGYTAEELKAELEQRSVEFDLEKNTWMDGKTEKKLVSLPKFRHSIKDWTVADKTTVSSTLSDASSKESVLDKVVDRIAELSINQDNV